MTEPIFVFDSRERFFPVGVEESLEVTGAKLPPSFPNGKALPTDRIDFPADTEQPNLAPVVYQRWVIGGPLNWHQFWLWYVHNPKRYAGFGEHEADWEFVQVGLCGEVPILVTASQHKTSSKREWWAIELHDGRPVIYVALDSHACYFQPGQILEDVCDGEGLLLTDYEQRPFGSWAGWGGQWGNSQTSPTSPGRQGQRWSAPHLWHSQAR